MSKNSKTLIVGVALGMVIHYVVMESKKRGEGK